MKSPDHEANLNGKLGEEAKYPDWSGTYADVLQLYREVVGFVVHLVFGWMQKVWTVLETAGGKTMSMFYETGLPVDFNSWLWHSVHSHPHCMAFILQC